MTKQKVTFDISLSYEIIQNSPLWKENTHTEITHQTIQDPTTCTHQNTEYNRYVLESFADIQSFFDLFTPIEGATEWKSRHTSFLLHTQGTDKLKLWNSILWNAFASFYSSSKHCGIKIILTWKTYSSQPMISN